MHGGKELQHRPSISSVHLQKILYFNAVLSLLFAAVMGAVAVEKAVAYHRYTPIAAIILWFLFEPTRLYNGFKGNLTEKVSNGFQILFYIYGSYLEFQHKRCISIRTLHTLTSVLLLSTNPGSQYGHVSSDDLISTIVLSYISRLPATSRISD